MEKITIINYKWSFSIAMLNYQGVSQVTYEIREIALFGGNKHPM